MQGFMNFFAGVSQWNDSGKIAIKTDKPFYVAGEMVTGNIFAQIYQPIQCQSINMKIKGYEKTEWLERRSRQVPDGHGPNGEQRYRTVHYYVRHHGRKIIFDNTNVLYQVSGSIQPGSYTWPFQYQLPNGLPGSFHERRDIGGRHGNIDGDIDEDNSFNFNDWYDSDDDFDDDGTYHRGRSMNQRPRLMANVVYKATAVLDVAGMFSKDLYAKQPLIIYESLMSAIQKQEKTGEGKVCFLCCIPVGDARMKVHCDKSAYVQGEEAQIIAEIDNDSSIDMEKMVVKLMRTLQLTDDHGRHETITEEVSRSEYEGVKQKEKATRNLPLQLMTKDNTTLQPTTTMGSRIKNTYRIDVECSIPWAPDVEVDVPCVIYVPQPPVWGVQPTW